MNHVLNFDFHKKTLGLANLPMIIILTTIFSVLHVWRCCILHHCTYLCFIPFDNLCYKPYSRICLYNIFHRYFIYRILASIYIIYPTWIWYIPYLRTFLLYQYHNFSSHLLMSIYRMLADVYIIYFKLAFSYVIYCILAPFFVIYRILAPVYICHKTLSCCCSNRCCS